MQYHQLGKSDLFISEVGFGCMSLGENEAQNVQILLYAQHHGINFFDTADLYQKGENEKTLGKTFHGIRDKVIIATKVGNQWRSDGSGWDWNPSKEYILRSAEGSLKRLQTDYIDLYQLHGGTLDDPIDEAVEAFEILKKAGKIRWYGISSIRPNVIREYINRSNIVSVMMQYSLLDRRPEEEILDLIKENRMGVLTRGTLAQGLLTGKPPKDYLNYSKMEVKKASDAVISLAHNRSPVDLTIKYVLHNEAVTSAILGIRTMEQLKEILKVNYLIPLTEVEMEILSNALRINFYEHNR